jgi:hypothetical protein
MKNFYWLTFFFFFWHYWGWNSGLHTCKAVTVPLEPHLQPLTRIYRKVIYGFLNDLVLLAQDNELHFIVQDTGRDIISDVLCRNVPKCLPRTPLSET